MFAAYHQTCQPTISSSTALPPTGSVHLVGQGRPGYNRWKRITGAQSTRCGHRRRIAHCGGHYSPRWSSAAVSEWVMVSYCIKYCCWCGSLPALCCADEVCWSGVRHNICDVCKTSSRHRRHTTHVVMSCWLTSTISFQRQLFELSAYIVFIYYIIFVLTFIPRCKNSAFTYTTYMLFW